MAERPDYEKAIALTAAPARKLTKGTDTQSGAWAVGATRNVTITATAGYAATLKLLWLMLPKADAAPTTGAIHMIVKLNTYYVAECFFGFAQWGNSSSKYIGLLYGVPLSGPIPMGPTSAYTIPSGVLQPATVAEWRTLLAGLSISGADSIVVTVVNNTDKAGNAGDDQEAFWILEEEAIA